MNDTGWIVYGQDEYLQSKEYQIVGGRVKINWNKNFDMDVMKFMECISNLKNTPLSHNSTESSVTVGVEDDNIITMSKTFDSLDSSKESMNVMSGDVTQTGNKATFTLDELTAIVGTIGQMK